MRRPRPDNEPKKEEPPVVGEGEGGAILDLALELNELLERERGFVSLTFAFKSKEDVEVCNGFKVGDEECSNELFGFDKESCKRGENSPRSSADGDGGEEEEGEPFERVGQQSQGKEAQLQVFAKLFALEPSKSGSMSCKEGFKKEVEKNKKKENLKSKGYSRDIPSAQDSINFWFSTTKYKKSNLDGRMNFIFPANEFFF